MSNKSKQSVIEGYVKDINSAFKSIYNRDFNADDSLLLNKTLYNILDSYFFRDLYNFKKMGIDENGQYVIKSISNGFLDEEVLQKNGTTETVNINQYQKKINNINVNKIPNPVDIDINYYSYFLDVLPNNLVNRTLTEVTMPQHPDEQAMKEALINIDSMYNVLFETSDLKKQLYLKQKDMLTFTIVPESDAIAFIKSTVKTQKLNNDEYMDYLKHNYDLRYCSNDFTGKENNNFYVFAHNNFELAGVTVIRESETVSNILKSDADKFMTVTSVMVAKNFRGQSLGVKMFDEVLKEAEKNEYILIRTGSSENGRNYLKDNITAKTKEYPTVPVIQAEVFEHLTPNLKHIFGKNSFNAGKNKLNEIISDIESFQDAIKIEKKEARSTDEFYAIADKEEDYFKALNKKLSNLSSKPSF